MADVKSLIQKHEGLRLTQYLDAAGNWTIGYGHNLDAMPLSPDLYEPDGSISEATADEILEDDIVKEALVPLVNHCNEWFAPLDDVRRAVLIDMCFNLGWGDSSSGLSSFKTFLGLVKDGDYTSAARDMMTTLWARQVGPRALEDSQMMESGQWTMDGSA